MKKITKLQERKKQLENAIRNAKKKGVSQESINKITGNRPVETIARSKNFDNYLTVIKERYSVEKTVTKAKEKATQRNILKAEKITGIRVTGQETHKYNIPNIETIRMTEKEYVELRKTQNELLGEHGVAPKTAEIYAKREYKKVQELAKKLNVSNIKQESLNYSTGFLDNYFINAPLGDYKTHIIKEYMKILPVQTRYEVLDMLTSDKFKKVYDSDTKNTTYSGYAPGEVAELRQEQLLKILRNETGVIINYDRGQFTHTLSKAKKTSNTIDNNM